ncbi:MAG: PorV/PorQ family protein [bacterium]|nr:PorV/PorQ family protein [bacterium]
MRKGMIIIMLIGISLFCQSLQVSGEEADVGTTSAQFLKISKGARAIGMGGAFNAIADDVSTLYWNPAGLGQIKGLEATFSYISHFQDINFGSIGLVQPTRIGAFGIGVVYLGHKDIPGYDVRAVSIGDYSANSMCVSLAYGKRFGKVILFGGSFNYISEKIENEDASGFAVDLGLFCKVPIKDLSLGLVIKNLGQDIKFVKEDNPLPLNFKLGLSFKPLTSLILAADFTIPQDNEFYGGIGVEYWIKNIMALRCGYTTGPQDEGPGVSGGIGFNISRFVVDYAFSPYGNLGENHALSLLVRFNLI